MEAPNRVSKGLAKRIPISIRIAALPHNIVNAVFMIISAVLESPFPRLMEKIGAPPEPKRLLKAVMIIMIGKHKPTAPSAVVPTSWILAI